MLADDGSYIPLHDVALERQEFRARLSEHVAIPQAVRIDIVHRGLQSGRVRLIGRVKTLRFESGGTELVLEPRMLHTTSGAGCLREFVATRLGYETAGGPGFDERPTGCFFNFDPPTPSRKIALARASKKRVEGDASRLDVNLAALCRIEGVSERMRVYRLEKEGWAVYIRTEGLLPAEGTRAYTTIPLLKGRSVQRVHLVGDVDWNLAAMDADGGAFRVHVIRVEDGADGADWRKQVARLAARERAHRDLPTAGQAAV